uniref:Family with sequence similarity 53 member B n=1 Tax=Periophthalmus magnuspinnatus TaxID=409849 RepID=A0A3B3ZIR9_9GOBI
MNECSVCLCVRLCVCLCWWCEAQIGSHSPVSLSQGESCWPDAALPRSSLRPKPDFGSSLDRLWSRQLEAGPGHCASLSSLLQDLNLSSAAPPGLWSNTEPCPTAPPSKRQCRSLSCFDDLGRSSWRPQGSRLWTSVEKRRCHSGGSVQRTSTSSSLIFPSIQRSSSVSLAFPGSVCPPPPQSQLSVSPHDHTPSPPGSPDSSPDTERRGGDGVDGVDGVDAGLPRSQSHPCELNEMKIGVKRRRQDEGYKRPSLDLAKMTQKLRSFHSLSRPGISSDDRSDTNLKNSSTLDNDKNFNKLYADKSELGTKESPGSLTFRPTIEDRGDAMALSTNQKEGEALWAGRCGLHVLGGELDIEQIERN